MKTFVAHVSAVKHSRPVFGSRIHVRKAGTAACTVKFRMSAAEEQQVRRVFKFGDRPMSFGNGVAELFSEGGGWWVSYGDDIHVDGALRALEQINFALNIDKREPTPVREVVEQVTFKLALKAARAHRPKLPIPVHYIDKNSKHPRFVLGDRRMQLALSVVDGKLSINKEKTKHVLARCADEVLVNKLDVSLPNVRPEKLGALLNKFAH